jgi:hypothetical protein
VLHGCASKKTGALRLAAKCKKSEKVVSWNAQGPTGVIGQRGAPGAPGSQGPAGPATGMAGGALTGTFPSPALHVTGGDSGASSCANGEALAGISTLAGLTCSPGVLTDGPNSNTAAGIGSLNGDHGQAATAFGYGALHANGLNSENNTAFGLLALGSLTAGSRDTAVGSNALGSTTDSVDDTAVGDGALLSLSTSAGASVAIGRSAGGNLKTGSGNTLIGAYA